MRKRVEPDAKVPRLQLHTRTLLQQAVWAQWPLQVRLWINLENQTAEARLSH